MPDAYTFAELAVALRIAAAEAAHVRERDEHTAHAIGLFPPTAAKIVAERQQQADQVGAAHLLFKAMIPHEAEILALIAPARSAA